MEQAPDAEDDVKSVLFIFICIAQNHDVSSKGLYNVDNESCRKHIIVSNETNQADSFSVCLICDHDTYTVCKATAVLLWVQFCFLWDILVAKCLSYVMSVQTINCPAKAKDAKKLLKPIKNNIF